MHASGIDFGPYVRLYERFRDQAAMDAHNDSAVVARFFGIAKPILDGDVILVTSTELSAKA